MTRIGETERAELLSLARAAVRRAVTGQSGPEIPGSLTSLDESRAAFVTLRTAAGRLRGCRGEIPAARPLPECVCRVAAASALDDPRFAQVTEDELPALRIEISVLTEPVPIRAEAVEVGRHGLLISSGWAAGLLLPQVPVDQGWSREEYLEGLCMKAGLPPGAWEQEGVELRSFEAEVWGDEDAGTAHDTAEEGE